MQPKSLTNSLLLFILFFNIFLIKIDAQNNAVENINLRIQAASIPANTTVAIPFYADNFTNIVGYQVGVLFPAEAMEFVEVESKLTEGFLSHQETGIFKALWIDPIQTGNSLAKGDTLFTLIFKTMKNIDLAEAITLSDPIFEGEAVTILNQVKGFNLLFMSKKVTNTTMNLHLFPNPTTGTLTVTTNDFSSSESVQLFLIDKLGRRVSLPWLAQPTTQFDWSHLAKGVYHLQVQLGGQLISRRFVKI